jgi:hypothetical protein
MYDVSLTVGDGTNTSTASVMEYLIVYPDPATPDTPAGEPEMCQDSPNSSYTTNNAVGATGWIWEMDPESAGDMILNGPAVEIDWDPDFSGTVQLTVASENLCGQSDMSDPLEITILPLPGAAGTIDGDDVVCQEQVAVYIVPEISGADEYEWTVDPAGAGTTLVNQNECTITWSDSFEGTATVNVYGTNDCGEGDWSPDFEVLVQNCTGIEMQNSASQFAIYPNPGNGLFTLAINNTQLDLFTVKVTNSMGASVYLETFESNKTSVKIDLTNLSDGVYYLRLESGSLTETKKVIIQR